MDVKITVVVPRVSREDRDVSRIIWRSPHADCRTPSEAMLVTAHPSPGRQSFLVPRGSHLFLERRDGIGTVLSWDELFPV